MLHEELGHRQPIAKQVAEHHDIGPAHVVADDEIPAILAQPGIVLNLPVYAGSEADHQGVATEPQAHEAIVEPAAGATKGRYGQQQFGQRNQQDQAGTQGGKQYGQAGADEQHQGAREQVWHECLTASCPPAAYPGSGPSRARSRSTTVETLVGTRGH